MRVHTSGGDKADKGRLGVLRSKVGALRAGSLRGADGDKNANTGASSAFKHSRGLLRERWVCKVD
jgi:hypothetical protein